MDCSKTGRLIAGLRKEKKLTQQEIADALNISNKTISKWECGLGFPDASLWPELSAIFGVEIERLLQGEITCNQPDSGNIGRIRFYVCPICNNILVSTGGASIFCCGRKMERLASGSGSDTPAVTAELVDNDYYLTIRHEMTKEHYILFAAYVKCDKVLLTRLYPEQDAALRLPEVRGGKFYLYCTKHGLTEAVL